MDVERIVVGDRVTVRTSDVDPIEICQHRHAVVVGVQETGAGRTYLVGHPWGSQRQYGPYSPARLIRGWDAP